MELTYNNEIEKDLIIKVELLKLKERQFLLNFIKGIGGLSYYYQTVKKIMKYAEDFI